MGHLVGKPLVFICEDNGIDLEKALAYVRTLPGWAKGAGAAMLIDFKMEAAIIANCK